MKEKGNVSNNALQKPSDSSMAKHLVALPAEFVMKTVRTVLFSSMAMEAMWWTGPNVTAVECVCTTAPPAILPLRMESYMVSVHAAEYAERFVQIV